MIDDFIFNLSFTLVFFSPIYNIQTFESSDDVHNCIESYHAISEKKKKENKEVERKEKK